MIMRRGTERAAYQQSEDSQSLPVELSIISECHLGNDVTNAVENGGSDGLGGDLKGREGTHRKERQSLQYSCMWHRKVYAE